MVSSSRSALVAVIAAAAVAGGSIVAIGGSRHSGPVAGGSGGAATANLWVNTTAGGAPARCSSPCAYSASAAYGSMDAAWDAATAGDTIRVKAGSYSAQTVTGNKVAETTFLAENGGEVAGLALDANWVTVENVVSTGNFSSNAADVTVRGLRLHGLEPDVNLSGARFTWTGGEFGFAGWNPTDRDFCGGSSIPIVLAGAVDQVFDGIDFYGNDTIANAACNHLEYFRLDNGGSNFTIRNSWFEPNDGSTTSTVFLTNTINGATYSGVKVENTFIGDNAASSGFFSVHENVDTCSNFTFAYNTFVAYPYGLSSANGGACGTISGWLFVGNLGPFASSSPCQGTHTQNRWQYNIAGSCGTDSWTSGTAFQVGNLGFNTTTGALAVDSVAVDDAETDGVSDYCTGALGSVDRLGGSRPTGAACDAGSDER